MILEKSLLILLVVSGVVLGIRFGTIVDEESYRYQVRVILDSLPVPTVCTGTLLTSRIVHTSCRCIPDEKSAEAGSKSGRIEIRRYSAADKDPKSQKIPFKQIGGSCPKKTKEKSYAIIELTSAIDEPICENERTPTVPLFMRPGLRGPPTSTEIATFDCRLIGYGVTENETIVNPLETPLRSTPKASNLKFFPKTNTMNVVFDMQEKQYVKLCDGDDGAHLVCLMDEIPITVGSFIETVLPSDHKKKLADWTKKYPGKSAAAASCKFATATHLFTYDLHEEIVGILKKMGSDVHIRQFYECQSKCEAFYLNPTLPQPSNISAVTMSDAERYDGGLIEVDDPDSTPSQMKIAVLLLLLIHVL